MHRIYTYGLFLSLFLLTCFRYVAAQENAIRYNSGKSSFRTLCSSCHGVHKEIEGPMLGSISKKRKVAWLIAFIQNSQAVIKSGDPYAVFLFENFHEKQMPAFGNKLSKEEIKDILYYIEIESLKPTEFDNPDSDLPVQGSATIVQGRAEFQEHCSSCHFIHHESYYAPALGSVTKRHSREWLTSFIHNSQKVIKGGDPYASHLFKQFDEHVMVPMEFLQEDEINAILDYIAAESVSNEVSASMQERKQREDNRRPHIPLDTSAIHVVTAYNISMLFTFVTTVFCLLVISMQFYLLFQLLKKIRN